MSKAKQLEDMCNFIIKQYQEKNKDYGDSFGISVKKYGLVSALTRMSDKFNRVENLIINKKVEVLDEKLSDTLIDLATYCLMTVVELENKPLKENKPLTIKPQNTSKFKVGDVVIVVGFNKPSLSGLVGEVVHLDENLVLVDFGSDFIGHSGLINGLPSTCWYLLETELMNVKELLYE